MLNNKYILCNHNENIFVICVQMNVKYHQLHWLGNVEKKQSFFFSRSQFNGKSCTKENLLA